MAVNKLKKPGVKPNKIGKVNIKSKSPITDELNDLLDNEEINVNEEEIDTTTNDLFEDDFDNNEEEIEVADEIEEDNEDESEELNEDEIDDDLFDEEEVEIVEEVKKPIKPQVKKTVSKTVNKPSIKPAPKKEVVTKNKTQVKKTTKSNNNENKSSVYKDEDGKIVFASFANREKPKQKAKKREEDTTIYKRDDAYKDLRNMFSEKNGLTLNEVTTLFRMVEKVVTDIINDGHTFRFAESFFSCSDRKASVNKSPAVDYYSYTGERKAITFSKFLGEPDKYRGYLDEDKNFVIESGYNYETGKFEPMSGIIYRDENGEFLEPEFE